MSDQGQIFGEDFLQGAYGRFGSLELRDFLSRRNINMDEVESLKQTSAMIQVLSDEAEVKQFTNAGVKLWVNQIKQLGSDAEDILDEYAKRLLRLMTLLEPESRTQHHQILQVRNTVPLTLGDSSVSVGIETKTEELLQRIEKSRSKVRDINEKLKSAAIGGVNLGLSPRSSRQPTSSFVNRSDVLGREEDVQKIMNWLLTDSTQSPYANDNKFSVLSIVGKVGSGKTAVAKLVYNHEWIEKHFGLKIWVCLSEDFDVVRLTKEILESATRSSHNFDSLDVLQLKLREVIHRKKFLLVLDNMCCEIYDDMRYEIYERWDALTTVFAFGLSGSKILVTTRNKGVASMVRTDPNIRDHVLKGLPDEVCVALFRSHAFLDRNSDDANRKLEVFGKEIMRKGKGLPSVIKTLAGLLRGKWDNREWEKILGGKEAESSFTPSYQSKCGSTSCYPPPHLPEKAVFNFFVHGGNPQISPNVYQAEKIVIVRNGDESSECVQVGNMLVNYNDKNNGGKSPEGSSIQTLPNKGKSPVTYSLLH